ncbi:MAG: ParB/RepB/Spo0J family partition protein [Thiovulaceae bacterium]|nr:ParB/RepB/Spo0J family partition protein [Sulfurimonadaceae bacterium]
MAKKSTGLGRGLGEIFDEITTAYENEIPTENAIDTIPIDEIQTNPYQPRKTFNEVQLKELSKSIKKHGLLQPIVVVKELDGYILIAGERRLRASQMANMTEIKATVVDIDISKFHELALIENIQREDLNPIDLASSYAALIEEHGLTHEELSERVHKSRAQITNTLRLLGLEAKAKTALLEQKISQGHAKILVGLDAQEQDRVVDTIINDKLSVREVEQLAKSLKTDPQPQNSAPLVKSDENTLDLSALAKTFENLGINITLSKNSCKLLLNDEEEVKKLVKLLSF